MSRLELRGRLQEAKTKYEELNTLASADVVVANRLIEPYAKYLEDDLTTMKMDQVIAVVTRLNETIAEMQKLKDLIRRIKEELGE